MTSLEEGVAENVGVDVDVETSCSIIENGTEWLMEHKMFVIWGVIVAAGMIYFMYFRNIDPVEEANSVDNKLLGENTDDLMKDLDINLTKNAKGEHLTLSSDDEEESEKSEKTENSEGTDGLNATLGGGELGENGIDTLSNDLNQLEEYTQESLDI